MTTGGGVVVAVVAGIVLATTAFSSTVLDRTAVEHDIAQLVVREYHQPQPRGITCPDQPHVDIGNTFVCDMTTSAGLIKKVNARITTADGHYLVNKPGTGTR